MTDLVRPPQALTTDQKSARLLALDVFRGLTVAAMILVNNQGAGGSTYPLLRHAEWDGWTPTDLVFPFFLFIVGVAIPFSLAKRQEPDSGRSRAGMLLRIVRRSVVIFALGLALNGFPDYHWSTIRIPGVLQRIAICYLLATMVELVGGVWFKAGTIVVLLLGYWGAMALIPAPGYAAGDLSRAGNLAASVDRAILPGHLYKSDYDPEGLLSTLPALATTLIGVLAGHWIRSARTVAEKDAGLFVAGWVGVILGLAWGAAFPINKALWTSSFVLLTAGLALQSLAVCYWLVDIQDVRSWSRPFATFGTNAIAAYVLAAILARLLGLVRWKGRAGEALSLKAWLAETLLRPWLPPEGVSLGYGLMFVAACYLPIYLMHRNRIYLRA